jgi:integrase/recombinase XerD
VLTLYRRHSLDCGRKDRYWRRCQCAMWVEGTLDREYMRKSLHTQSWERAQTIIGEWERAGKNITKAVIPTIGDAADKYIADCIDRNFSQLTVKQHTQFLARFGAWCQANNYQTIGEIDTEAIRDWFAAHPKHQASTRFTGRMKLSAFFNFCKRQKWIKEDPVKGLGKLIVRANQTDYLEPDELQQLLAHIEETDTYALVLLMRWSGLRITDALSLERRRIDKDGMLFLYQSKTGTPVQVPLPKIVTDALTNLKVVGKHYLIYDGQDPYNMGVKHRNRITKAAGLAKLTKRVHPHMLRDTFAIELLLKGVPLDQVSILLGHKSIKTTEKHYAPFVKARQEQLNQSVRLAWG